jgi:membrane protease YdiL (CAAX protease family)
LTVVVRAVTFIVGCAVLLAVSNAVSQSLAVTARPLATGAIAAVGAFALTWLFARWDKLRLADVGAKFEPSSLPRLLVGFVLGLVLVSAWAAIYAAAGYVRWSRQPDFSYATLPMALLVFLALSCREELAFHGYPLRRLQNGWGIWPAQLLIAALFALEHKLGGLSWIGALFGPAVGSLLFGMASIATEGLAVPMGIHAAWNLGHWTLGFKDTPGVWQPITATGHEQRAHVVGTASYIVVFGVATFLFWAWHRRRIATAASHD